MSIVKTALIVLGGTGLFAGSFVGVSIMSGHSFKDIPLLSKFSKEPATPVNAPAHPMDTEPAPDEPPAETAKTPVAMTPSATASVLGAFVLPSPFSSDELSGMQSKLAARVAEADASAATAKKKERDLDDRERALLGRETELQKLKETLDSRSQEMSMREMEIKRDADAATQIEAKSWVEVARFFQDGEPEDLAKKLSLFDPDNAARVLRQLDDERAIALVNALPPEQYKTFLDAYRKTSK